MHHHDERALSTDKIYEELEKGVYRKGLCFSVLVFVHGERFA